jgi:type I restriction-modification system DNA methylase subunit
MIWVAPSERHAATNTLDKRLWDAADQFRANSGLSAAQYSQPVLLKLPEASDIGAKVNDAMRDIEKQNPQLSGVLPKTYNIFTSTLLKGLLKMVSDRISSIRRRSDRLNRHSGTNHAQGVASASVLVVRNLLASGGLVRSRCRP